MHRKTASQRHQKASESSWHRFVAPEYAECTRRVHGGKPGRLAAGSWRAEGRWTHQVNKLTICLSPHAHCLHNTRQCSAMKTGVVPIVSSLQALWLPEPISNQSCLPHQMRRRHPRSLYSECPPTRHHHYPATHNPYIYIYIYIYTPLIFRTCSMYVPHICLTSYIHIP